ncbi:MAG: hypothetical protein ACJAXJ_000037 [Colwellia sp.]|jgi:hypothetical protein
MNNRVYISGYWQLKNNVKKSPGVYLNGIEKTFKLIKNSTLYFFTEDEVLKPFLKESAKKNNIHIEIIHRTLESLPANKYIENVINSADATNFEHCLNLNQFNYRSSQEKGFIHYFRDYKHSGKDNYKNLLRIWLSKILLVNEIIAKHNKNNRADVLYSWIDCTAERFSYTRKNWNFTKVDLPINKFSHYSGSLFYMGVRLPISASFMSGGEKIWEEVETLFINELERAASTAYAHDEETLLTNIVYKNPDLFYLIGSDLISKYVECFQKNGKFIFKRYVYYRNKIHELLTK